MDAARECRLFVHDPGLGDWNMAVDEVLLERAANDGTAALRLYQWSEPTLSLGYFQRYADRAQHAASAALPAVRRLTGGGALVHDQELTYSLALPASHPLARQSNALYRTVHRCWIAVLGNVGVRVALHENSRSPRARSAVPDEPLLCFQRRSPVDVVAEAPLAGPRVAGPANVASPPTASSTRIAGRESTSAGINPKIIGSAQRRRRGAVLQHGSVLTFAAQAAPGLPGISEAQQVDLRENDLGPPFLRSVLDALDLEPLLASLTAAELQRTEELRETKYSSPVWIQRR